jgi:hypothetical protein
MDKPCLSGGGFNSDPIIVGSARHGEERSDEAIQSSVPLPTRGLPAPPDNMFKRRTCRIEDWIASLRSR